MPLTPTISVCMPMHNASRYLRECIGSVLAQTYADFEFLIADDGSTDNSVAIVESYSDPRIRLIKRPHDYIATLNCLLNEARGKYIARMDADDVMLPHRLQTQFDYMEAHPDVDILGCDTITIDEDYSPADTQPIIRNITFRDFVENNQLNHPTVFLRSEALNRYSLRYDNRYIYAEDYKLWSEFAKRGCCIVGMGVPVLRYRIHSEQASEREAAHQIQLKLQIQRENRLYAVNKANPSYSKPKIWSTDNELTIIIPFLNEGIEAVNTVASIREYAGNTVDIIVINDSSYDGIDYGSLLAPYNVYYFVNYEHSGVAASRDMGVSLCRTPYFLLLDAHMRFYEAECFDTICRLLSENDRRLLCCQSVPLIPNKNGVLSKQTDYRYAYGAYMPFDMSSLWPDIRWNNYEKSPGADIERIELVLGAGYAASVRYWQYLKGLTGLRGYGFDEAYISAKVWMEGGECLLLKKHTLGHLYRGESPYKTSNFNMVFNALLITTLLMTRSYRNWSYAIALHKEHEKAQTAISQIRSDKELQGVKLYYQSILPTKFDAFALRNIKSQSKRYADLSTKIDNVIKNYITWLDGNNENDFEIGLRNGGLSSQMLIESLYAIGVSTERKPRLQELLTKIESSLPTNSHSYDIERGLCGVGWLLIGLYRYGILSTFPETAISLIDNQLSSLDFNSLDIKDFNNGIGAILCYACARIYAADYTTVNNDSDFTDIKTLLTLRELAVKAVNTPECDSRTYYHALDYLDATSEAVENYDWSPNLYDVVTCTEKPILEMSEGGYDLFDGVIRNWCFAIIHKLKISRL